MANTLALIQELSFSPLLLSIPKKRYIITVSLLLMIRSVVVCSYR
jgi:hypothetical protein